MKRIFCIVAALLLVAVNSYALDYARPSDQKTADALVYTGEGVFYGILVATDGTNAATIDVYDGTTATGTRLVPTITVTTSSIDRYQIIKPPAPVIFHNGIYVDITCSGTLKYEVYFY